MHFAIYSFNSVEPCNKEVGHNTQSFCWSQLYNKKSDITGEFYGPKVLVITRFHCIPFL